MKCAWADCEGDTDRLYCGLHQAEADRTDSDVIRKRATQRLVRMTTDYPTLPVRYLAIIARRVAMLEYARRGVSGVASLIGRDSRVTGPVAVRQTTNGTRGLAGRAYKALAGLILMTAVLWAWTTHRTIGSLQRAVSRQQAALMADLEREPQISVVDQELLAVLREERLAQAEHEAMARRGQLPPLGDLGVRR